MIYIIKIIESKIFKYDQAIYRVIFRYIVSDTVYYIVYKAHTTSLLYVFT